ncbi:flagellar hook-length control protein FliK [Azospirillum brasilense]|uniref:Flagellar hook-length control protein FliK n=1 Tax=Azospirillum brasilense TaxID=192 RepID=A0A560C2U9_AZOBR|nr:flagellar hook-length control protein FliK [Azospirillum brasilense]TWA79187.1 flagellar hook-length control protein FliK [Azospirillum brasilense]
MAIQTNTAPSAFESLVRGQTSSSQNTAPRSDKFASMMDRLITEAATRKRDQVQAEASAQERRSAAASAADQAAADRTAANRAAERKAAERSPPPRPDPIRAEPAKPRQAADANTQADARAARKDEAQRTAERKDSRAFDAAKAGDSAHATRTERREAAASAHATAKEAKAANAKAALDDAAKATPAGVTTGADLAADTAGTLLPDDANDATGDGGARDGAGGQGDDGTGEAVILDLTVTVTETTVEMVTADQSAVLTDREAALALAVAPLVPAPLANGRPDDAADKATEDGTVEATAATTPPAAPVPDDEKAPLAGAPATDAALAAAEAAAAALAAAGAPHPDGKTKPAADETVTAAAAAKPVAQATPTPVDAAPVQAVPQPELPAHHAEAKDAAKDKPATADALSSGALPVADLPNDDSAPLPQSPNELAAAKAKGATRTGADGDAGANAGNRGNPDPNGNAASLAQPPAPQAPLADPAKPAGQSAFLNAAAAAAADAPPPADGAPHATTPTHAVFAGIEGTHTASGVETGLTTTQLRPSRGSAGLPMGVQEQVAVHISKNVSDGNDQFTINLRPAELGRIDIKLDIGQDGRVTASVAVEKAQTLELLQRDSRNLERALQDAGLKADSNSLNFSLRGEGGQSFQESGRQGGSGRRGRGFGGGTGEVEDAQAAYTLTLAPGRVDIQA